jgi:formiminotetrahydrofolate cyclodeaminase
MEHTLLAKLTPPSRCFRGYYGHLPADISLWKTTLENFRDRVANAEPAPAGVSVSAVSARLGLGLVEKVLRIVSQRKDFSGDLGPVRQLGDAARTESARLARYADEDIAAFNEYMACRRLAKDTPQQREERECAIAAALRTTIEVPMNVARSAIACIDLCTGAAGFVHAFVAADLGAAAELLAGAVRATLLSVDFNLRQIPHDSQFYRDVIAERNELQSQVLLKTDALMQRIATRMDP